MMDLEQFEDAIGALLEGEGFEREECLGYHSNNAPDDATGFVKGELGVIFFEEEGIVMEIMRDMRHGSGEPDWCSWSQVRLPNDGTIGYRSFQKTLAEAIEAMEELTWR